jgi:hypothetical protein
MSHHGNNPPFIQKALVDEMSKLMGEYPEGRLNADDSGALAFSVGVENGKVLLRFPKPVAWIGFTGDQALEIAELLIRHARHAGVTSPLIIRLGADA